MRTQAVDCELEWRWRLRRSFLELFTELHSAVRRSLWILKDESCLRGRRKGSEEIIGCLLSGW